MDDDDSLRNWAYYEPTFKEHLGMSPIVDTKPFLSPREHPIMPSRNHPRSSMLTEPPMQYMRDAWMHANPNFTDSSGSHSMHLLQPCKNHELEDGLVGGSGTGTQLKKRSSPGANSKSLRAKKSKEAASGTEENGNPSGRLKTVDRSMDVVINGIDMDISGIPIPVCSCTGVQQQCYRWGSGGWQSACCTTIISIYPLPMSTKRPGARIAGRKMSQGAFKKVLERLSSESYNFANAIDLRLHWAKHGTNKFVTIR